MTEKIKSLYAKVRPYAPLAGAFLAGVATGIAGMVAKDRIAQ